MLLGIVPVAFVEVTVQLRANARASFFILALATAVSACQSSPPPVRALPWLVEVASIDSEIDAGLTRCGEATCERLREHAVVGSGSVLRAERGARVVLALDPATDLTLREGAEIELVGEAERTVRVRQGSVLVVRRENAPASAPRVALEAAAHAVVLSGGPTSIEVRAEADGEASAVVLRGRAGLRGDDGERVLLTGEGARWKAGGAVEPVARWQGDGEGESGPARGETAARSSVARGLGTMTARVPGTNDVVSGVRLATHHVTAEIRDGFARTTVDEEFANDTARTLEGRFVFPLPPDASISRLALYVGEELVEGEIVSKPLATRIFKAIVDDTVRPRDPALLEWTTGSTVSLKVFPIPAKGKRRVILAYDQALSEQKDRVRYVYPLSLGADRATTIDDFAVSVLVKDSAAALGSAMTAGYDATLHVDEQGIVGSYSAKHFAPAADFVLRYARTESKAASLSWSVGPKEAARADSKEAPAGYFAVRLRADAPAGMAARRWGRSARAFVIDASHSQSLDTMDASIRVTRAALANLDPDDRFVVLACDSACESYPEAGLARAGDEAVADAGRWLAQRAPGGSSDVAGALLTAAERLEAEGGGQVVYLGDGVATSGELGVAAIGGRVEGAFRGLDAHFVGVGHSVDEGALRALSASVGGTYERLATGDALAERVAEIARTLEAPVLREAKLVLPEGAFDVHPARLPRVRLGQEIQVFGRFRPGPSKPEAETVHASLRTGDEEERAARGPMGEVRLTGKIADAPYEIVRSLDWDHALASPTPAVHALWARAEIAALELSTDPAATKEIVRLSTVHHVLSRGTALLVLENERMFVETGVRAAIDEVLASEPAVGLGGGDGGVVAGASSASGAGARGGGESQPFGMTGMLSNPTGAASPWGSSSLGEGVAARGNMWGSGAGDGVGAGGLGLTGIGQGGGGRGEGIGLGSVGTIGHGSGTSAGADSGQGFGSGHGRLGGSHKTSPPQVRMGATSVSGRLPPEVIQRIVRQNFGRFRLCYEQGLRSNPNLQGRVAVRFVIDRQGNVTSAANGGSDLPDPAVVSCVVRSVAGLSFPVPEDGVVTVTYPILFAPDGGGSSSSATPPASAPQASSLSRSWRVPVSTSWPKWAPNPLPDSPTVVQTVPEESSLPAADGAITKLLAQVAGPDAPRSAHQALVKKLLARGRFDEAFAAASRYLGLDPDHEVALELYAQAAAVTGRMKAAVTAVDAQVEAEPTQAARHRRAAAAFEAAGDERRACAHFRALASLPGADDGALYHSLRCRARLGERAGALAAARATARPGTLVSRLTAALESGSVPPYEPTVLAGSFEVRVICRGEGSECPSPIVVGPTGTVVSPWTPASPTSHDAVTFTNVLGGAYRTLVSGPVPEAGAELTVRVLGQSKTVRVVQPGTRVMVVSTVTLGG